MDGMRMTLHTRTVDSLCELLDRGDEADRCYVIRTFGALRETAAFAALAGRLHDEDIDVCVDAAEALGRLGDPAAIHSLLESLHGDPSGEVRTAVVEALGRYSDPRVVAALIDVVVRRPQDLELEDDWDDWWDMQRLAVVALGRLQASEAVAALEALLDTEEGGDIEGETLRALAQLGTPGLDVLQRRLVEGEVRQRGRAARALGHADGHMTLSILAKGLLDAEDEVRIAVLDALAERRAGSYLPAVLLALKDRSAAVRGKALEVTLALAGSDGDTQALATSLFKLLEDVDPRVRRNALLCLTRLVDSDPGLAVPVEPLRGALVDSDTEAASAACTLAGRVGGAALVGDLLELLAGDRHADTLRREAALALGMAGTVSEAVVAGLQKAVTDTGQPVRVGAMTALVQLAESAAAPAEESTTEPDPLTVVVAAVRGDLLAGEESMAAVEVDEPTASDDGVAGSEVPESTSTLAAIARDNVEAAMLLDDRSPDEPPVDPLAAAVEEDAGLQPFVEIVRGNLERAEQRGRGRGRKVALSEEVRRLAARMLGDSDAPTAVAALIDVLLDGDVELSREAADALGRIARRSPGLTGLADAFGVLVTLLGLGKPDQRIACVRALAALGNRAALEPMLEQLDDPDPVVRGETVRSLTELATAEGEPEGIDGATVTFTTLRERLDRCLDDAESGVRLAAAEALARLQMSDAVPDRAADEGVRRLIEAAFHDAGGQARAMGQALRAFGTEYSATRLLQRLDELETSQQRRFVLEMIEELYRPEMPETRLVAA